MAKFELFKDKKGEFRWRLKANNHKVIADSGEGYKQKASCNHGIDLVKQLAKKADFEVFQDKRGEFRWRLKAENNQVIADSGEGYKRKTSCKHGIGLVKQLAKKAKVEDETKS